MDAFMPASVSAPHGTCENSAALKTRAPVCGWRACWYVALVHPADSGDMSRSKSIWLLLWHFLPLHCHLQSC